MNTKGNTVLITGGGSGIGLEIAKRFSESGNTVIIAGRNKKKLEDAAASIQGLIPIVCDITNDGDVSFLVQRVTNDFPELNILINNAGKAYRYFISDENADAFTKAQEEIATNFLAPVRLTGALLPLLKKQNDAAVINISSIVSFTPGVLLPTYSATKAALHSYSQSLRVSLSEISIKVFEVLPPLVDTDFVKSIQGEKIPPSVVANAVIEGLEKDQYEIHIGATAALYKLYLSSPAEALKALNKIA